MKTASLIARLLLGLIFVVFGLNFFFHFLPMPQPHVNHPAEEFMAATVPTGFLKVVHALEIAGGFLLLAGRFVNLGLTLLGPIVVNILLFHFLLAGVNFGVPMSYALPVLVGVLFLITLARHCDFVRTVLKP